MGLVQLAQELAWPSPESIMKPTGPGPSANLAMARRKIESAVTMLRGGAHARVGLLYADSKSTASEAPLAIVCTFEERVPTSTLVELHRAAWNFSNSPLLLTIDETEVRAFSCSEPPSQDTEQRLKPEIIEAKYVLGYKRGERAVETQGQSAALHWLEIATGSFLRKHQSRFQKKHRADSLLLDNLRHLRTRLKGEGLSREVIHDLLARTIFVQFLFDRKDAQGFRALSSEQLERLHEQKVLSRRYETFADILDQHDDTYRLFHFLDQKFNGDLFPSFVAGNSGKQPESEEVQQKHLNVLSEFIRGNLSLRTGQRSLWPMYSFDSIPLDFISSIYESFVEHDGQAIYTPAHLVDFVLDGVLPWDDANWNLKVLDPSCGSGIFLVKALRRLVHRWKLSNGDLSARIPVPELRRILERNLVGIDINPHAVRVASFSLYLAMCDEIEPKHLWSHVKFPSLRNRQLRIGDFFDPSLEKAARHTEHGRYDIIVGNAPWGKNKMTGFAYEWANQHEWSVSNGDIGPMFLAKSASLCKTDGIVSMLQPTGTLLTNTSSPAEDFRKKLFGTLGVTEVVNFSAMRFGLFRKAVSPCSLITLDQSSANESIDYVCPKPTYEESIDSYRVLVDPYDIHEISLEEATSGTGFWTTLFWGTRRDLALMRKLRKWPSLLDHKEEGKVNFRRGIIRGDKQTMELKTILGRLIFEETEFPEDCFLSLGIDKLPLNDDPTIVNGGSTNISAFEPRQMLIKMTWKTDQKRFRAVMVDSEDTGVLCSRGYISVRSDAEHSGLLEDACTMLNSKLAVYYELGHSGRFVNYRPEPEVKALLATPIPAIDEFDEVDSFEELDERVYEAAKLNANERALVSHAVEFVLPTLKAGASSITVASAEPTEPQDLKDYCDFFMKMLSKRMVDHPLSALIFDVLPGESALPVRFIAITLGGASRDRAAVVTEQVAADELRKRIANVYTSLDKSGSIETRCPRVARAFGFVDQSNGSKARIPAIYIVKSDQQRYWTPAMAIRDADDVSAKMLSRG
ncbi:MAG: N-6 DNA methylase [Gammaproteobacteria bacterium]|nr:N-6 DNA methylase [Gammaproteobacteria bacterium]